MPRKASGEADGRALGADLDRLRSLTCIKWSRYDDDVIPAWVADMDLAPRPSPSRRSARLRTAATSATTSRRQRSFRRCSRRGRSGSTAGGLRPRRSGCSATSCRRWRRPIWLHTEPGDGVVLFTPVYFPFFPAVTSTGRRIVDCPLDPDGWRIDPGLLASVIDPTTRAILLCNPHNPTGRVFDAEELSAIAEVAERHDLLVISDEIWGDLTHPGAKHVPIASLGDDIAARTVTITAASKAFNIAGLHCAVAHVGHSGVAEALTALPRHLLGAVGSPGAEATLAAWTAGEPWLGTVRAHLTAQRDHLAVRLADELPGVGFDLPEATYLAWLDFRELGLGDSPEKLILERGRVALSAGLDFGAEGAGFARLNFATSREILDEIVDRIVLAVRDTA